MNGIVVNYRGTKYGTSVTADGNRIRNVGQEATATLDHDPLSLQLNDELSGLNICLNERYEDIERGEILRGTGSFSSTSPGCCSNYKFEAHVDDNGYYQIHSPNFPEFYCTIIFMDNDDYEYFKSADRFNP